MGYKTRICQRCGSEYQPTSAPQKYCVQCGSVNKIQYFAQYYLDHKIKRVNTCPICGEGYTPTNSNQIYCKTCGPIKRRQQQNASRKVCTQREKENNPEGLKEKRRRWGHTPSAKKSAHKRVLKRYGMTPEQYDILLLAQGGVCPICGRPLPSPADVDHDHRTGKVRGLLCTRCNLALGLVHDDAKLLRARCFTIGLSLLY